MASFLLVFLLLPKTPGTGTVARLPHTPAHLTAACSLTTEAHLDPTEIFGGAARSQAPAWLLSVAVIKPPFLPSLWKSAAHSLLVKSCGSGKGGGQRGGTGH